MVDLDALIAAETVKINQNNKDANAYAKRGIARCCKCGSESDYEKAIEDLALAQALGSSDTGINYYRALSHFMIGEYKEAEEICNSTENKIDEIYKNMLLAEIHFAKRDKNSDVVEKYNAVINNCLQDCENKSPDEMKNTVILHPAFFQNYKKAKERLKDNS